MEPTTLAQSPFAALTFIAAPALLTNASSVLALSTINRMLRTRDRMHELFAKSEGGRQPETDAARLIQHVTLLGTVLVPFQGEIWFRLLAGLGVMLGLIGVGGLVFGSASLFQATQLSLINIREEAALIRERQGQRRSGAAGRTAAEPGAKP
jgi:hypothetical protein